MKATHSHLKKKNMSTMDNTGTASALLKEGAALPAAKQPAQKKGPPPRVRVGDRVRVVKTGSEGFARYVGAIDGLPSGLWVGVDLDEPVGKNDGEVKGSRLFVCAPLHGSVLRRSALVVLEQVSPTHHLCSPPAPTPHPPAPAPEHQHQHQHRGPAAPPPAPHTSTRSPRAPYFRRAPHVCQTPVPRSVRERARRCCCCCWVACRMRVVPAL